MKTNQKIFYLLVMGIVIMLSVAGLLFLIQEEEPAEKQVVEVEEVLSITGLAEDKEISLEELKKLDSVDRVASWVDREGNKHSWKVTGILLDDFLRTFLGKSQQDFHAIRLSAGDNYSIEVPSTILRTREIILAYEINGQPLKPEYQPLRVIIPNERRMFWVFNLIEVELIQEEIKYEINRVIILETAMSAVDLRDHVFDGETHKAVRIRDIMNYFAVESIAVDVVIKATDSLKRNERTDTFIEEGYLKITGDCAPRFFAPGLPRGMHVRNVLWFSYGETAFFSIESGLEVFKPAGEKGGLAMREITRETGLREGESYMLTAIDGSITEISAADMDKGVIYVTDEGKYVAYFPGKEKIVKEVLSIETITD